LSWDNYTFKIKVGFKSKTLSNLLQPLKIMACRVYTSNLTGQQRD
jgi:hypothetical protein